MTTVYIASVPGKGNATSTSQLTSWTGIQAHGVNAAPGFVDGAGLDFHLTSTSPALNKGIVLSPWTDGYTNGAPDMGRYER